MDRLLKVTSSNDALHGKHRGFAAPEPTPPIDRPVFPGSSVIYRKSSCACGGGCPSCQAKNSDLKVSQPGDAAEIEADGIADKVMRTARLPAEPVKSAGEHNHRKESATRSSGLPGSTSAAGSGGQALDGVTRAFFEPRLGYDLGAVRVHAGVHAADSARSIDALAYTYGQDVYFGAGQY